MTELLTLLDSQGFVIAIAVLIILTFIYMYKQINCKYIELVEKNQELIFNFSQTTRDFSDILEKYSNIIVDIKGINHDIDDIKNDIIEIKNEIKQDTQHETNNNITNQVGTNDAHNDNKSDIT